MAVGGGSLPDPLPVTRRQPTRLRLPLEADQERHSEWVPRKEEKMPRIIFETALAKILRQKKDGTDLTMPLEGSQYDGR